MKRAWWSLICKVRDLNKFWPTNWDPETPRNKKTIHAKLHFETLLLLLLLLIIYIDTLYVCIIMYVTHTTHIIYYLSFTYIASENITTRIFTHWDSTLFPHFSLILLSCNRLIIKTIEHLSILVNTYIVIRNNKTKQYNQVTLSIYIYIYLIN